MPKSEETKTNMNTLNLPEGSGLTPKVLEEMENLFDSITPSMLRKDITELFFVYLIRQGDGLPWDIDNMTSRVYALIHFLEVVDEEINR